MSNRITKPHHNAKSSDRRLASGVRPESYLLSERTKAQQSRLSEQVIAATRTQSPSPQPGATNTHSTQNNKNDDDGWDPKSFRLFVGNLGTDANDMILLKAFSAYPSVSKVRVPVDKAGVNKGYGFVEFKDANDYLKAFKEVNGKYIGHHPCTLKKANDLGKQGKKRNNNDNKKFNKRR